MGRSGATSSVNAGPVLLPPLLKYFGWTRARVSTLGSAGALMAGACGPLVTRGSG